MSDLDSPFAIAEIQGQYITTRPVTVDELVNFTMELLGERLRVGSALNSVDDTKKYFIARLVHFESEVFTVAFLDNRHRVIACSELFYGTIDGASVHPREVVKRALKHNAAAVILAHNHPSGVAEPSTADERITERLRNALELIDVRVLDHIIVGGDTAVSFAERGLLIC